MSQPNGNILIPGAKKSLADISTVAQGLFAQNYERGATANSQILIGGTAYGMLVPIRAGSVVANVYVQVTAGGTSTSLFKAAVFSKDLVTRYATGAGTNADFNTLGTKAVPLSWTCPADDGYMVVIVSTGSTLPTLLRSSGQVASQAQIGTGAPPCCTAGTGLSDVPAAGATMTVANGFAFWVGLA